MKPSPSSRGIGGKLTAPSERRRHALTSAVVRCIAGFVDDQAVVDVIRTGASEEQLIKAVDKATHTDVTGSREFDPAVERLVRILRPALARLRMDGSSSPARADATDIDPCMTQERR